MSSNDFYIAQTREEWLRTHKFAPVNWDFASWLVLGLDVPVTHEAHWRRGDELTPQQQIRVFQQFNYLRFKSTNGVSDGRL